jgi:hypothetical protein
MTRHGLAIASCLLFAACAVETTEDIGTGSIESTVSCPPTTAPIPFGPNGEVSMRRPTFSWSPIDGALYTLYIIDATTDAIVVRATGIVGTSYVPTVDLPTNVQLRWKVKGESVCGPGPYSPSLYFSVSGAIYRPTSVDLNPARVAQLNDYTAVLAQDGNPHMLQEVNTWLTLQKWPGINLLHARYEVGNLPGTDLYTLKIVAKKHEAGGDTFSISTSAASLSPDFLNCIFDTTGYKTCYYQLSISASYLDVDFYDSDRSYVDYYPNGVYNGLDIDSIELARGLGTF